MKDSSKIYWSGKYSEICIIFVQEMTIQLCKLTVCTSFKNNIYFSGRCRWGHTQSICANHLTLAKVSENSRDCNRRTNSAVEQKNREDEHIVKYGSVFGSIESDFEPNRMECIVMFSVVWLFFQGGYWFNDYLHRMKSINANICHFFGRKNSFIVMIHVGSMD